jgi:hypothetical protein
MLYCFRSRFRLLRLIFGPVSVYPRKNENERETDETGFIPSVFILGRTTAVIIDDLLRASSAPGLAIGHWWWVGRNPAPFQ